MTSVLSRIRETARLIVIRHASHLGYSPSDLRETEDSSGEVGLRFETPNGPQFCAYGENLTLADIQAEPTDIFDEGAIAVEINARREHLSAVQKFLDQQSGGTAMR